MHKFVSSRVDHVDTKVYSFLACPESGRVGPAPEGTQE
jgi:hypothetical protein